MKKKERNYNNKKKSFMMLMKRYKGGDRKIELFEIQNKSIFSIDLITFKKHYTPLLGIIYVFNFNNLWLLNTIKYITTEFYNHIYYYAKLSRINKKVNDIKLPRIFFYTLTVHNIIVFSKPKKQLFLLFFKEKPVFIFTGGQMRLILKEVKKSSKKLYKVAISLIKFSTILLYNNTYFNTCYLRLINIGSLRVKLLREFKKKKLIPKIFYIFFIFCMDMHAQKFKTRRAIKKYIKKRFKI